ncbi:TPA: hypothetical protein GND40_000501 [Salmonella enterica subsp. indica]|uniref:NTF2 fold domain-containing protein n=2 Tax=Salmonella enterica TaxID=28901 RepID=A0A753A3H7_SALER|nr:NTF2 fold immunity protein [Salmonella enterica]EEM2500446.1 hypothetical protein [Salmonella enterica subsp. indica serovar 45:a:e,n,x]HAC6565545.1 hypothetical protein [Salmonella enterica subsp. indica]HCM1936131.1 hypothetical protein [Salmonella enterica subsp. indica serovar 6,7:z41:1,7]HAE8100926.1 hypothetical protein [Salmonella enterica subsp. indica serovar 45:a:e,n,x]HAF7944687.1 hypothetical protein [Salmonella enterica subsp. indica]
MRFLLPIILFFYPLFSFGDVFYTDIVGNQIIAEELAFVYVKNIYGKDTAIEQKPYRITESKNSWLIKGRIISDDCTCGNFIIRISKKDGAVKETYHTK